MKRRDLEKKPAQDILEGSDATLLDIVDNLLNRGVVVKGDLMLGVAKVDLVYLQLTLLLCAADKIYPGDE